MIDLPRDQAAVKAAPQHLGDVGARSALTDAGPDSPAVIALDVVRMRALLPQLVSRCMAYAAQPAFDDVLVAGVEAFYGLDVDVATAETQVLEDPIERVRFFPWLLWDRPVEAGDPDTIGARFAREGELEGREARLLEALNAACVWFWQVAATSVRAARTELIELATGRRVTLWDRALPAEVAVGEVLQARLVELTESGLALLDAVHFSLPSEAVPPLEAALGGFVRPDGQLDVERVREATPTLFDLAARLAEGEAAEQAQCELLTTLRVPPAEATRLRVGLADDLGAAEVAFESCGSGAIRCHLIGDPGPFQARLEASGVCVDPLVATRDLDRAIRDMWLAGRFPRWSRELPRFTARLAELREGLVAGWTHGALPGIGRTPIEATRDAWGLRDLEAHLARLTESWPLGQAEGAELGTRLRALLV